MKMDLGVWTLNYIASKSIIVQQAFFMIHKVITSLLHRFGHIFHFTYLIMCVFLTDNYVYHCCYWNHFCVVLLHKDLPLHWGSSKGQQPQIPEKRQDCFPVTARPEVFYYSYTTRNILMTATDFYLWMNKSCFLTDFY